MRVEGQPLYLVLVFILSLAMLAPAAHALSGDDFLTARSFFYTALLGATASVLVAVARGSRRIHRAARSDLNALLSLFAGFVTLPLLLAVPYHEAVPGSAFVDAYVDIVSALTTTGMPPFDNPRRLPPAVHLWRAEVAWIGGFTMWVAAATVLAPLSIGGFEVTSAGSNRTGVLRADMFQRASVLRRMARNARVLGPIYVGLTGALWIALMIAGDGPLVALCHAMSTLATSGISPIGGVQHAQSGIAGEVAIALFLLFALSRITFSSDTASSRLPVWRDAEFRVGILLVVAVPLLLFLRHWFGAIESDGTIDGGQVRRAVGALWGSVMTVLSFLTTTGFVSQHWVTAQTWSGLATPELVLLGLAIMGGGVATTAGGVKLLRVYVLYLNGVREMERLVHPSSVSGVGPIGRRIRRHGTFHAWVFFMLFAITLSVATALFALLGSSFEDALVLSIAGLSNTGPLIHAGAAEPIRIWLLSDAAKLLLSAVMILGRLELLAIIALFNPNLWRD